MRVSRKQSNGESLLSKISVLREPPVISIIISARDNSSFLGEAIQSAISQTVPAEVIYSDDCSTDNSVEVARGFGRAIKIIRSQCHAGVCDARNRGASLAKTNKLIFLDGDDRLPSDFAERHLSVMSPGVPFAYPRAKVFGDHSLAGHVYPVPEWRDYDQWRQNTCNTSCCYDRTAFLAAGGWRDAPQTMWDWDLALRAARFGTPVPSPAVLDYRYHECSWSDQMSERVATEAIKIRERVRRLNVRLSVGCIYSGRLPGLIPRWCKQLANSIRLAQIDEQVELLILDNSPNGEGHRLEDELLKYPDVFSCRIIPFKTRSSHATEQDRRNNVASFMATASNHILDESLGDVFWFVEDDILVPMNACDRMLGLLCAGDDPPQAVTGAYVNRHGTGKYVAGDWWTQSLNVPKELTHLPVGPRRVDVCGTGCLMFWRTRIGMPNKFNSHVQGIAAHDWEWCKQVNELKGHIILDPNVACGHVVSESEVV